MDSVYELRQYTLHPGQRDVLIDLFEREFVETQEAAGMRIPASFRDLDDPDRFVWLRSFQDMGARPASLAGFYGGPAWKTNRDTANGTLIDSDNVLLLRPTGPGAGFALDGSVRPPVGAVLASAPTVLAVVHSFASPIDDSLIELFDQKVLPQLDTAPLARLCTLEAENNFPALPVRTGEHVLVWFTFDQPAELLAQLSSWDDRVVDTEVLRLAPTARSLLH